MKARDKLAFKKWAKVGLAVAIVMNLIFYGIFPFDQAKPEAKIASAVFVHLLAAVGIITLAFYLATQKALFDPSIDGFLTASGLVTEVLKLAITGQAF